MTELEIEKTNSFSEFPEEYRERVKQIHEQLEELNYELNNTQKSDENDQLTHDLGVKKEEIQKQIDDLEKELQSYREGGQKTATKAENK